MGRRGRHTGPRRWSCGFEASQTRTGESGLEEQRRALWTGLCKPPNLYVEALTLSGVVIGDGVFKDT